MDLARRCIDAPDGRIFPWCFILGADITAVHGEPPFGINADEDTGSRDVDGIKDDRPLFERHQGRFDFAEPLIDFIRQFVRILVVEFELGLLGIEHSNGRLLLGGEIGGFALKLSEAAIGP